MAGFRLVGHGRDVSIDQTLPIMHIEGASRTSIWWWSVMAAHLEHIAFGALVISAFGIARAHAADVKPSRYQVPCVAEAALTPAQFHY